ncbi:MAG: glycosyltransferase family 4 protein, partial [Candidatus Binatia bacterium]
MNIFFFGQNGIFGQALVHQNARRVWALAQLLAERGNQVTIFTAKVHNPGKLAGIGHIRLVALPSFNPEKPGGWLYLLLGLRHIWHEQPEVVHIHGWKAAFLVRLAALLSPETAYVWTISALPQKPKWILKILYFLFCHGVFDAISTPSRQLQYRLLTEYKTRVAYIPDGYREPVLSNIPSKRWGRRHGQYCLAVVSSSQESKWIIEAYKQSKTRKKLLIVSSSNKADRGFMKKISSVDQLNIDYVRQSRAFSS